MPITKEDATNIAHSTLTHIRADGVSYAVFIVNGQVVRARLDSALCALHNKTGFDGLVGIYDHSARSSDIAADILCAAEI